MTADIFAAARRRWWLVLAGLLLTAGLVVGAQKLVGPSYEATASVLLLPSKTTLNGTTNPYLLLGGVNNARDAVMVRLSAAAGDDYPPNGPIQVTVATDPNSPAPLLELSAVSPTQEQSRAVLDTLLAKVEPTLVMLQSAAEVPQDQYIQSLVVARPQRMTELSQASKRAMVVAGVGGLALTLVALALVDRLLRRRTRGEGALIPGPSPTTSAGGPPAPGEQPRAAAAGQTDQPGGEPAGAPDSAEPDPIDTVARA